MNSEGAFEQANEQWFMNTQLYGPAEKRFVFHIARMGWGCFVKQQTNHSQYQNNFFWGLLNIWSQIIVSIGMFHLGMAS